MSNTTIPNRNHLTEPRWEPKFPFDLVIAYEDTTTRNRALSLYDHLAQQLLDDYDFQCTWWKLGLLNNASLQEQASDAAAEANMVVVSLRAAPEISETARRWTESWMTKRGNQKSALVTIIAGDHEASRQVCPIQAYMRKVARAANMDFFAHRFDAPDPRMPFLRPTLADRATLVTPLMEEILDHKFSFPRWGINE